ncbi:SDR family NAD(P)-dependent oxidoreductase [Paramicrobacterium sp. CJ85]|uniref:SDR family NAD(P)-dependent oxidoreductase n=1 Tax=Paramicrobacterium sp. CJ85 TaxID=3445355 RepID=UPI003F62BC85
MAASMRGRTVVVTGANAGLGFWTSLSLAASGARIVMACRHQGRADAAARAIRARVPNAELEFLHLDTSSLSSVASAGSALGERERIDALIANAGIIHVPSSRQITADGLELVAATNAFGHAALIRDVLPVLTRTPASRIVSLGSLSGIWPWRSFDDPQVERRYSKPRAYASSKTMLQVFGFELDRRLAASGHDVRSLVAHPGYSISGRTPRVPAVNEPPAAKRFVDSLQAPLAQSKRRGALPVIAAATDPAPPHGAVLYGPRWMLKGPAVRTAAPRIIEAPQIADAVWDAVETAIGGELRF